MDLLNVKADYRSGFVAIIGKPNTGKSTLLNKVLGEKLSITSSKPQTTRYAIKGILSDEDKQVVFIDTPGYLKPRYELQKRMIRIWSDSFKDVDLVIFMADVTSFPTDYDLEVLGYLEKLKNPLITVFNKIDRVAEPDFEKIKSQLPPNVLETVAISALNGTNIDGLMATITKYLPFHDPYYTDDQLSDLPMRFFAQETIREGIFRQFEEEIPYATAVLIEKYSELPKKVVIDAVIWIERQSQKPIIIGKNGENLQRIREYAERELTHFVGMPVLVHLWVKINPNWRKKNNSLRELGFE